MTDVPHILIVDDEPEAREEIAEYLGHNGFQASVADGGSAMRTIIEQSSVDLVILDLMMPGEDGLTLTDYLRKRSDVGIIILTGKPDSVDQIVGLEIGADDYLSKPCDLRQLLARVRSVLRRRRNAAVSDASDNDTVLGFGKFRMSGQRRQLIAEDGGEIPLTTAEFDLLWAFAMHAGRAVSRDVLLDVTRSRELSPFDRSIDILVSRLRRKVERDAQAPEMIKTIRGVGYMFTPRVTRL
jgi:two-component system OmpR family response regulator